MARCNQEGTKAAQFEELSLPQMAGLYNLALHFTHRAADAEDLVQETYLKALRSFGRFRPGTNFKAWIFKILRNTFISHYHRQRVRNHVTLDLAEPDLGSPPQEDSWNARIDAGSAAFREALSGLPHGARTMLVLAYVEGFTYREIADVMGCPAGTVMSRLSRARRRLRERLESCPVGRAADASSTAAEAA